MGAVTVTHLGGYGNGMGLLIQAYFRADILAGDCLIYDQLDLTRGLPAVLPVARALVCCPTCWRSWMPLVRLVWQCEFDIQGRVIGGRRKHTSVSIMCTCIRLSPAR
jgi:hypothetical protein